MSMLSLHWPLYSIAFALLAAGSVALWTPKIGRIAGRCLLSAGLVALALSIGSRWLHTGRPPVLGTYENSLTVAWSIAVVALLSSGDGAFGARGRLARLVAPWSIVALGYGSRFEQQPLELEAIGRSVIGYVHAFVGWLDFAALIAATMAALGLLFASAAGKQRWDEALGRWLAVGFALLTATMATGSINSFLLFSEWYRWQLVETFAATIWVAYALILHARLMFNWRGRRFAVAALGVTPLLFAAFWIWSVYPHTYHFFENALRLR